MYTVYVVYIYAAERGGIARREIPSNTWKEDRFDYSEHF